MSATNLVVLIFLVLPVGAGALLTLVIRRHRRRHSILLLVVGNLLTFLCLATGVLALGELYYRFVYDKSEALHVSLAGKRWTRRHYRHNNVGMRDNVDYASRIAAGRRRITVLGDSFTNGHGIVNVEDRYANLLRRAFDEWEVHVLARDGRDTGAILDSLREALSEGYQVDCVLYAYGLNDVVDLIPEWEPIARSVYRKRSFLIENSYLLNTYYYRYKIGSDPDLTSYLDRIAARYEEPAWESQARRLSSLTETERPNWSQAAASEAVSFCSSTQPVPLKRNTYADPQS